MASFPYRWRYSLRWSLPHRPCPGEFELAAFEVDPGTRTPAPLLELWRARPPGYAICLDFPQSRPVRRWSEDARARVRRNNLVKRVQRTAPLFADELMERELAERPEYFAGKKR
jgi:hypothetical protein